jgi:hypothetical protein
VVGGVRLCTCRLRDRSQADARRPSVGLHLTTHSYRDVVIESAVVVACWLAYRSSLREEVRYSVAAYAMPLGVAMQVVFAFLQAPTLT